MVERRLTGMLAAAGVLIVLFVVWDAFKPAPRPIPPPEQDVIVTHTSPPAGSSSSQGTVTPDPTPPPSNEPNYMEALARSEMRRRIRASAGSTYLNDMLAASQDSMLRRWDNRMSSPVRVWFAPTVAANFQPAFIDAIRRAFGLWSAVGVPVAFDLTADSTDAEVVFLVAGEDKAEAVARAFGGLRPGPDAPSSLVRPESGNLQVLLDSDAAKHL